MGPARTTGRPIRSTSSPFHKGERTNNRCGLRSATPIPPTKQGRMSVRHLKREDRPGPAILPPAPSTAFCLTRRNGTLKPSASPHHSLARFQHSHAAIAAALRTRGAAAALVVNVAAPELRRVAKALPRPPRAPAPPGEAGTPPIDRGYRVLMQAATIRRGRRRRWLLLSDRFSHATGRRRHGRSPVERLGAAEPRTHGSSPERKQVRRGEDLNAVVRAGRPV